MTLKVPVDNRTLDWPRKVAVAVNFLIGKESEADLRYVMQDQGSAWTAPTGTASRATFATYAGQTVSNPPTQAQVQAIDDHVKLLSERVKAIVDDLKANGTLT